MATVIDWHAHHTAPEVAARIGELTGKKPHIDPYDAPDLSKRVKSMKIFNDVDGCELSAELKGTRINDDMQLKHEIKSVTYHQVEIFEVEGNYSTLVVFDI